MSRATHVRTASQEIASASDRSFRARERGREAERLVAAYLESASFRVLGLNVRLGNLELDIVAQRGELVVIVEVRARGPGSFVGPLQSITPRKRATLLRAAERLWREKLAKSKDVQRVRIDVAAVHFESPTPTVEYIEGAIVGS